MERFNGENQPKPSPVIHVECEDQDDMMFTWDNTTIRLFDDPQFNHVEHRTPEGKVRGISVTQEFMDLLFEHSFPQYSMPNVDDSTYEWYVTKETMYLDDSIARFEQTGDMSE